MPVKKALFTCTVWSPQCQWPSFTCARTRDKEAVKTSERTCTTCKNSDSHLTDDEEDDGHGGAEQRDQHEELEPKNQTLNSKNSKTVKNTNNLRQKPREPKHDLIVQASGLGHGGQRHPLPADVAEDLKNHEAEEEEVETGADPCHDDEGHLKHQSGKLNYYPAPKGPPNAAERGFFCQTLQQETCGLDENLMTLVTDNVLKPRRVRNNTHTRRDLETGSCSSR